MLLTLVSASAVTHHWHFRYCYRWRPPTSARQSRLGSAGAACSITGQTLATWSPLLTWLSKPPMLNLLMQPALLLHLTFCLWYHSVNSDRNDILLSRGSNSQKPTIRIFTSYCHFLTLIGKEKEKIGALYTQKWILKMLSLPIACIHPSFRG